MIEAVSKSNIDEVLPLIREYQTFYNVAEISDDKNSEFFIQFGESNPAGCQFIYRENGSVIGFATVYFSFASTITAKVGVLNDLYTLPRCRGKGVGRKLLEHCRDYAAKNGASRLQWVTAPENQQAQKLYDSLQADKRLWQFYTYKA